MNWRPEASIAFLEDVGWAGAAMKLLAADASFRSYLRVRLNHGDAVLMDAPPPQEDVRPFVLIAKYLTQLGFSAPRILAEDPEKGFLLLEDLGDDTYTKMLNDGGDEEALYSLAVDTLIQLHEVSAPSGIPRAVPAYDTDRLLAEAMLFVDWYLPGVTGTPVSTPNRAAFEAAFRRGLEPVGEKRESLVLRDYHVDNLMWLPERDGVQRCGLLDFQDALIGSRFYDLMSLLEDARRDIAPELRDAMMKRYMDAFPALSGVQMRREMAVLGAGRHAKVIGIFTRLAHRDGKPHYLDHIPRVWRLLERSLSHPDLADLAAWFDQHVPEPLRRIPDETKPKELSA